MAGDVFQINGLCVELKKGFVFRTVDNINRTEVYRVSKESLEEFVQTVFTVESPCIAGFHFRQGLQKVKFVNCFSSNILQLLPEDCDYLFLIVVSQMDMMPNVFHFVLSSLKTSDLEKSLLQEKNSLISSIKKQLLFLGHEAFFRCEKTDNCDIPKVEKGTNTIGNKDNIDINYSLEDKNDFSAAILSKKIVPLISSILGVRFLPVGKSRKVFADPSNSFGIIVSSSKHYCDISRDYWYAIKPEELEKIDSCDRQYLVFGCQYSPSNLVFLIPMDVVKDKINTMRSTLTPEGKVDHWHVDFKRNRNGELCWIFPRNDVLILSNYLVKE